MNGETAAGKLNSAPGGKQPGRADLVQNVMPTSVKECVHSVQFGCGVRALEKIDKFARNASVNVQRNILNTFPRARSGRDTPLHLTISYSRRLVVTFSNSSVPSAQRCTA